MSEWPSSKARRVLAALLRIGPKMLARLANHTGLKPKNL